MLLVGRKQGPPCQPNNLLPLRGSGTFPPAWLQSVGDRLKMFPFHLGEDELSSCQVKAWRIPWVPFVRTGGAKHWHWAALSLEAWDEPLGVGDMTSHLGPHLNKKKRFGQKYIILFHAHFQYYIWEREWAWPLQTGFTYQRVTVVQELLMEVLLNGMKQWGGRGKGEEVLLWVFPSG